LTAAIARTHPVQGVDVDPQRVAFAAREYAPIGFSPCEATHLPFPDQSFDVVVSMAVIHFVPDPVEHIREAGRVLRDPGWLLIGFSNVEVVRNAIHRLIHGCNPPTQLWLWRPAEARAFVRQQGFEVEAETYYYDPPLDGCKNLRDVFLNLIQQVLSLLRVRRTCSYFLLLARKAS
jgi:SAM-dependent methyltransferase